MKLATPTPKKTVKLYAMDAVPIYQTGIGTACPNPAEKSILSPRFGAPSRRELPVSHEGSLIIPVGATEPVSDPTADSTK